MKQFNFTKVESFDDSYFKDIQGYNALMLSDIFYSRFLKYKYILIHQLDAFVFKDELNYWCDQGFDYIGAPWMREYDYPNSFKALKRKIKYYFYRRFNVQENNFPSDKQLENQVGNGGFSLRRVQVFHDLCVNKQKMIQIYLNQNNHTFNEDVFWSIEVNRKRRILKIPRWKAGLKFSIELAPERAMRLNNNQLPFGCHAWDKYLDFWRDIFKAEGYNI
ncbi:hypothetical protein HDF23_003988 [Mucilaginibacter lappiensis]|uniref:DUF5672 domain-containing protein n=1 Tax=Mucilaginibacter lappiensis TaxID=354630 RepID=A0ABR6PNA4_9SPHI|nr:DUF5672 family protein [Mucilaginibacter lappiensis]MBB6111220.1 hypothetical protein [Mucilaginibacter lappiensis]